MRSSADVISPLGAKVAPGEIFELTKWNPAESAPLLVWHWPSNLSQDQILAAAAEIKAAGVISIADPAEEPWTHILCWDGANWTLQETDAAVPVSLGGRLRAKALKRHLPAAARLWANLPPSKELAAKLIVDDVNSNVQPATGLTGAHYALTGVLGPDGLAYAWFHKSELVAGAPPPGRTGHSPGCSSESQYPVRSDWVSIVVEEAFPGWRFGPELLCIAAGQGSWLVRIGGQPRRHIQRRLLFTSSFSRIQRNADRRR